MKLIPTLRMPKPAMPSMKMPTMQRPDADEIAAPKKMPIGKPDVRAAIMAKLRGGK